MDRTEPRHASAGGGAPIPRAVAPDPADGPRRARRAVATLRAGAVAALITLSSLALVAGVRIPSATAAGATAAPHRGDTLTLVRQSPWVGPAVPAQDLTLGLRVSSRAPKSALALSVTVFHRLITRSAFEETLAGRGLGSVLTRSPALGLGALSTDAQGVTTLTVPVQGTSSPAGGGNWTADLGCDAGSCTGVYPVKVALSDSASSGSGPSAQFVTYLVYDQVSSSTVPLRVAVVVPLGLASPAADASGQVPVASAGAVDALGSLITDIGAAGPVPLTVVPEPASVGQLGASRDARVVSALGTLTQAPARQALSQSFVPVAAGALVDAGLGNELDAQLKRGAGVLAASAVPVRATRGTWVSGSALDQPTLDLLAPQFGRVVVPQDAVSGPTGPLTPTQPFTLTSGKGSTVTAMTADPELDAHLSAANGRDPVLAAEQMLADLAFVYYEDPNLEGPTGAVAPRGMVAVAPQGWSPGPGFVSALLGGLQGNPVLAPVTLDQLFTQVPVGSDREPTVRHPVGTATHSVPAAALRTARARQDAFASAASQDPAGEAVVDHLEDLLLASESSSLSGARQRAAVNGYEAALGTQLTQLSVRSDTIRLTAGAASVPITVVRNSPYPVAVELRLTSDKLQFPASASQTPGALCRTPVVQSSAGRSTFTSLCVLTHTTNAVYVNMRARTSGDFRIDVALVSPQGALVLASGHLTVRSMSTSAVAIGLSALAGAVLLLWWGRTVWRGKWGRRGAHARKAGAS